MRIRDILLALFFSLFLAIPGFAEDQNPEFVVAQVDGAEPLQASEGAVQMASAESSLTTLEPKAKGSGPITLEAGQSIEIRTTTTTIAKPSVGGLYTDCLPDLCAVESSGESPVEGINWAGVRQCCENGMQCFWVDAGGRNAITDDFFRCVTANTPDSPYIATTKNGEVDAKKKPVARNPKNAKGANGKVAREEKKGFFGLFKR